MKNLLACFSPALLLLGLAGCQHPAATPAAVRTRPTLDYAIGADLSFLRQAELNGTVFKDEGRPKPGLNIFRDHGYKWIRLRLFHTPKVLPNDLAYTLALAREATALGYKILLDFHYSDTWADPQQQTIPQAWSGKTHAELTQLVLTHTRDTIRAFRAAGVMPAMVQIGNEVRNGLLWPDAHLPENWVNFTDFLKAGIAGVDAGRGAAPRPLIMIHFDRGGDPVGNKSFYDHCASFDVDYDVIGLSYYPWWHGSLLDLRENLNFLAETYPKDIVVVETAYNWRPAEYPDGGAPFPETPEGQRNFLDEVNRLVLNTPHHRGKGVFWWEPAVALNNRGISSRGMFDHDGNALPVISLFDKFAQGLPRKPRK